MRQMAVRTPWQRAYDKFNLKPAALARALKCHRSKISRALKDEKGLINGTDQERLLEAARELKVDLTADDITPDQK